MARALIVGCGCRGRALGRALIDEGWVVRGTSRRDQGLEPIAEAGIEPQVADPDRIATVLDAIEGVALIYWLMGSAEGEPEAVADLHGPRLERLLEEIVDTPVRGLVYELTDSDRPRARAGRVWRPERGRGTLADPVRGRRLRSARLADVARGDGRSGPGAARLSYCNGGGLRSVPVQGASSATRFGGWSRSSASSLIPIAAPATTRTTIA